MKSKFWFLITMVFSAFSLYAEDRPASKSTEAEKGLMDTIERRMNYGDKQALTEADKMRPSIAIPYLAHYTDDRTTDPVRAEIARQTLAKIPGLEDYYRPILAVPPKEDFDTYCKRLKAFRVLSILKTKEAIRLIVSSLFDESVSHPDLPCDVKGGGPIKYEVVEVLERMGLPGAPKVKFTAFYEDDVEKNLQYFETRESRNGARGGRPTRTNTKRNSRCFCSQSAAGVSSIALSAVNFSGSGNATLFLEVQADPDGDGMGDAWETACGLNPADPADAALDLDGDDQSNRAEWLVGTVPNSPASRLAITSEQITGADVQLVWAAVVGKRCRVLQRTGLVAGLWSEITPAPLTATGPAASFTHPGGASGAARFYRVEIVP